MYTTKTTLANATPPTHTDTHTHINTHTHTHAQLNTHIYTH